MQLVDLVRSGRCREVAATREATARFDEDRTEAAKKTVWYTGCGSWHLDDRGCSPGNPGIREWWALNPYSFSPEFRSFVEGHIQVLNEHTGLTP